MAINAIYQKHHVIPISLDGFDWSENIIRIKRGSHKLIHSVQDVPYAKVRAFRKATNHMKHKNCVEYVTHLRNLHLDFFENVDELPVELYKKQRDSLAATTKRLYKKNKVSVLIPKDDASLHQWLKIYHNILALR